MKEYKISNQIRKISDYRGKFLHQRIIIIFEIEKAS